MSRDKRHKRLADLLFPTRWMFIGFFAILVPQYILSPASAFEVKALVENVSAERSDLKVLDFLESGFEIELRDDEQLTLSYLASCVMEKITGGRVVIGEKQSLVKNGMVSRSKLKCNTSSQTSKSNEAAAVVFRAPNQTEQSTKPIKAFSIYPVLKAGNFEGNFTIQDMDRFHEPLSVPVQKGVADLGKQYLALKSGVTYRVTAGEKEYVFIVDEKADRSRKAPYLVRLIVF
ncbi:hypothetical protein [Sneathiella limimaris]|uniref:hypothetical protein n=1 Tax=Sneathiella limimaris TaxID=1964213 RepID=UPI001469E07B|nr:hypothetical protein [Sneathiella limimaris]